jgi:AraC family transcriptional regulator of adaptative response/methylated-DNA-[protein]-cysteine methyltransferase
MNENAYWQAVLEKNSEADGTFYYAVRTTGIYCRPSCPSRRPNRHNVEFFITREEAEKSGYRSCRRCMDTESTTEFVQKICNYIEKNLEENLTLEKLGAQFNTSPFHLQRMFKKVTGTSPRRYVEACRHNLLKNRLKGGDNVTTATFEAGFNSGSRVYQSAGSHLGMTPGQYQKGGAGVNISYTITTSPIGYLLLAATEKGVCKVSFGDSVSQLEVELKAEFPRAIITRNDARLDEWARQLVSHLEGRLNSLDVPMAIHFTPFQQKVWEELRKIPYGNTCSYQEIARAIGQPTAARAVAQACASNPVALIIPCHRVVRGNGDMGGYRWGLIRKKALLEKEHENSHAGITNP